MKLKKYKMKRIILMALLGLSLCACELRVFKEDILIVKKIEITNCKCGKYKITVDVPYDGFIIIRSDTNNYKVGDTIKLVKK